MSEKITKMQGLLDLMAFLPDQRMPASIDQVMGVVP
jgi:hypothetical protein